MVGNLVALIQSVTDLHLFTFNRNESFSFAVSPLTPKVSVCVHDHKTLGKDKDVAEGEVEVMFLFLSISLCLHLYFRSGTISSLTTFHRLKYKSHFAPRALCACASNSKQELIQT